MKTPPPRIPTLNDGLKPQKPVKPVILAFYGWVISQDGLSATLASRTGKTIVTLGIVGEYTLTQHTALPPMAQASLDGYLTDLIVWAKGNVYLKLSDLVSDEDK